MARAGMAAVIPRASPSAVAAIEAMLAWDPARRCGSGSCRLCPGVLYSLVPLTRTRRPTADQCLALPWLRDGLELPVRGSAPSLRPGEDAQCRADAEAANSELRVRGVTRLRRSVPPTPPLPYPPQVAMAEEARASALSGGGGAAAVTGTPRRTDATASAPADADAADGGLATKLASLPSFSMGSAAVTTPNAGYRRVGSGAVLSGGGGSSAASASGGASSNPRARARMPIFEFAGAAGADAAMPTPLDGSGSISVPRDYGGSLLAGSAAAAPATGRRSAFDDRPLPLTGRGGGAAPLSSTASLVLSAGSGSGLGGRAAAAAGYDAVSSLVSQGGAGRPPGAPLYPLGGGSAGGAGDGALRGGAGQRPRLSLTDSGAPPATAAVLSPGSQAATHGRRAQATAAAEAALAGLPGSGKAAPAPRAAAVSPTSDLVVDEVDSFLLHKAGGSGGARIAGAGSLSSHAAAAAGVAPSTLLQQQQRRRLSGAGLGVMSAPSPPLEGFAAPSGGGSGDDPAALGGGLGGMAAGTRRRLSGSTAAAAMAALLDVPQAAAGSAALPPPAIEPPQRRSLR